jgi:hypothetical protein
MANEENIVVATCLSRSTLAVKMEMLEKSILVLNNEFVTFSLEINYDKNLYLKRIPST